MRRTTKQRILAVFVYVTSTSFLFLLSQRYFLVIHPSVQGFSAGGSTLTISRDTASDSNTNTNTDTATTLLQEFDVSPAVFGTPLEEVEQESNQPVLVQPAETLLCDSNETPLPLSPDGKNIAIMVQRGGCSFETKARNVVRLYQKKDEVVKYLIVYDNVDYGSQDSRLIRMTSDSTYDEDPMDIPLSLLFISKPTAVSIIKAESPIHISIDSGTLHATTIGSAQTTGSKSWEDYITAEIIFVIMKLLMSLTITLFSLALTAVALSCVWRDGLTIEITSQGVIVSQVEDEHEVDPVTLLSEEQVMELPEVEYSGVKENDQKAGLTCPICLEDVEKGEKLRELPCGHMYHTECILPWLTTRAPNCPMCKASFEPESTSTSISDRPALCASLWNRRHFQNRQHNDEESVSIDISNHSTIPVSMHTNTTPRRRMQRNQSISV